MWWPWGRHLTVPVSGSMVRGVAWPVTEIDKADSIGVDGADKGRPCASKIRLAGVDTGALAGSALLLSP